MDNLPNEQRVIANDAYAANQDNIERPPTREALENQDNIDRLLIRQANRQLNEDRQQLAERGQNVHGGKRKSKRKRKNKRKSRRK
jgi:hypothetical protein